MAGLLFQQQVKDFNAWKKLYDSFADLRASNGALTDQVFQDENDPNKITILFKWDSLENAKKYTQLPELKAAMKDAGVEGPPQIHYLNEA